MNFERCTSQKTTHCKVTLKCNVQNWYIYRHKVEKIAKNLVLLLRVMGMF